jgi:hypothetical protein
MRSLAAFSADVNADVLAVCEIDAGDAFALATRFAREWAYRGGQALFWTNAFVAHAVHDVYLPFVAARPFDRRGLLRIDGAIGGAPVSLFATQFARERSAAIPELRFARAQIRSVPAPALVFARLGSARADLAHGYEEVAREQRDALRVYARGMVTSNAATHAPREGIGAGITATVTV